MRVLKGLSVSGSQLRSGERGSSRGREDKNPVRSERGPSSTHMNGKMDG